MFNTSGCAIDFFYLHKWKNNNIAHFWAHVIEYKKILTLTDLQITFFIHIGEERMVLHICEPTHGFLTHKTEKKNDIVQLQACKWFFRFMHEKNRKDLAHLQAHNCFFLFMQNKKGNDNHTCWLASGFSSIHISDKAKWYFPFVRLRVIFFYSHRWRNITIFHTCNPISVF